MKERCPPHAIGAAGEDGGAERRERKNGGPPHAIGAAGEDGGAERRERKNGGPPHAIGAAGEDGGGWGVRKRISNLPCDGFTGMVRAR